MALAERVRLLEERARDRDREIALLCMRISLGRADLARLASTVEALRSAVSALRTPPAPPAPPPRAPSGPDPPEKRDCVPPPACSSEPERSLSAGFASLIVADFPALFAEFRGKAFTLLWRGSRDGFGAGDFHGRCDGRAPTLTLVRDTGGNIFGGFTPVEWESRKWSRSSDSRENNCLKADPTLESFLFTLRNPHRIRARKFTLKSARRAGAIWCDASMGPYFGQDLSVCGNCSAHNGSGTRLGSVYTNDTGLEGQTVFTGSWDFTVKEIEVFEITDYTALLD
jgi:hypothetical protein